MFISMNGTIQRMAMATGTAEIAMSAQFVDSQSKSQQSRPRIVRKVTKNLLKDRQSTKKKKQSMIMQLKLQVIHMK